MNTSKIIKGVAGGGRYTVTAPIIKEDYGLYLKIEGLELPATYEVDFSNSENSGTSVTMIGNSDGVLIPRQFISSGKDVFAFLYHVGADFGRTVYKFRIPNKLRPDRTEEQPTPEEQSVIDQTIAAVNEAVGTAREYANNAADSAEETARKAGEIEELTAAAQTLAPGSEATATYQNGILTIGVPRGDKGDKGDTGERGPQGEQGVQGIQGIQGPKGEKGDPGDDYTLTEQDKQDIADMVDVPVDDVQINGASIVEDGVANVPVASQSVLGAVKVNNSGGGSGIKIENGTIKIVAAEIGNIKASNGNWAQIVPSHQHESTFYGLAKAAGHDEKNSTLPVGEYTEEAKIAIQKMLGIYEPPYELLNDFTLNEESSFDLTADMNGTPYDLRNVFIYVYFPANSASATSGYARYRCYDANNNNTNAETGRYGTNTQAMFKYVTVERKANMVISSFTIRENTGRAGTWRTKPFTTNVGSGVVFNLGNITRIACIDPEPAGTRIQIYAQRAY